MKNLQQNKMIHLEKCKIISEIFKELHLKIQGKAQLYNVTDGSPTSYMSMSRMYDLERWADLVIDKLDKGIDGLDYFHKNFQALIFFEDSESKKKIHEKMLIE